MSGEVHLLQVRNATAGVVTELAKICAMVQVTRWSYGTVLNFSEYRTIAPSLSHNSYHRRISVHVRSTSCRDQAPWACTFQCPSDWTAWSTETSSLESSHGCWQQSALQNCKTIILEAGSILLNLFSTSLVSQGVLSPLSKCIPLQTAIEFPFLCLIHTSY